MMEDTSFLTSAPGALVLSIALMLVCVPLRATPRIPNWTVPYICLLLGSIGFCVLEGWTFRNHLIGVIIGGCAVGLHQSVKQGKIGWREFFEQDAARKEHYKNAEQRQREQSKEPHG